MFLTLDDAGLELRSLATEQQTGRYRVRLNRGLSDVFMPLSTVRLSLPKGDEYEVIRDNQITHPSGSFTWFGYLRNHGDDYRVVITTRRGYAFGRILTPSGEWLLESDDSGTWLINPQEAGWLPDNLSDDAVPPPFTGEPITPDSSTDKRLPTTPGESAQAQVDVSSTVDVMLLYTAGMAARYGSGLQARLDNLIALANQAYIDSQVSLTLRLVHIAQVSYSETTSNGTALDDLTNGSDVALASVAAWRNQYGADLVALLRPYNKVSHNSCGQAWINGSRGQALDASNGFAAVSDGNDTGGSNYFCDDYTLSHELGHTMGNQHDRGHATFAGAYPYSYGYGFDGEFGTIMSYLYPRVGKFSSPLINCLGNQSCGVADYADNARSLNNTRTTVAAFRAAQSAQPPVTESPTTTSSLLTNISTRGWVGTGDSVMIGGFIISGSAAKQVLITAKGPALAEAGVPAVLNDPMLTLYNSNGQAILENDDWGTASNAANIQAHGAGPRYGLESAILTTLAPGAYTAIVRGVGATTGNALVEVYDLETSNTASRLVNISTRGWVGTGDSVMIGGFIISGNAAKQVLITAKGPALAEAGVPAVLNDPMLTLYNSNGQAILENDDWGTASNAANIQAHGAGPRYGLESAILTTLAPGAYTAIVRGVGATTGNALIEVYEVQ
ncbi:MAG: hypothetical protein KDJ31_11595 [Candidatus Competibacteraceae bacterium]|nr:hypothetical protein [Candidatus Competibacteraceae bacterium]